MARQLGLAGVALALWWLAILEAVFIALRGAWSLRLAPAWGWRSWRTLGPACAYTGVHTVPLGLAVIVSGAAAFPAAPHALLWWGLVGVWIATVLCVVRFVSALAAHGAALADVDGTWFLVPAALLGAAIASADVAHAVPGAAAGDVRVLAWAGAVCGGLGYWAMAALAAVRVLHWGLQGAPRAPWWIAMGCAGLAAGALGTVASGPWVWPAWGQAAVRLALGATQAVALVLLVPVLLGSVRFLWRDCGWRGRAVWPPTFSTAVFALGAVQAGAHLAQPWLQSVGWIAAWATLILWGGTMLWNIARWGWLGWRSLA